MKVNYKLPVLDGEEWHKVELEAVVDGHGVGKMLDHSDEATLSAFSAFGAQAPCLAVLKRWREHPLNCLFTNTHITGEGLLRLAAKWAGSGEKYLGPLSDEDRLRVGAAFAVAIIRFGAAASLDENGWNTLIASMPSNAKEMFETMRRLLAEEDEEDDEEAPVVEDRLRAMADTLESIRDRHFEAASNEDVEASGAVNAVIAFGYAVASYIEWRDTEFDLFLLGVMAPWHAKKKQRQRLNDAVRDTLQAVMAVADEIVGSSVYGEAVGEQEEMGEIEISSPARMQQIKDVIDLLRKTEP